MDKRYVELIADNMTVKIPIQAKISLITSFVLLIVGFALMLKGLGIAQYVAPVGVMLFFVSYILIFLHRKKQTKAFMQYYDQNNELPAWPEKN